MGPHISLLPGEKQHVEKNKITDQIQKNGNTRLAQCETQVIQFYSFLFM